MNQDWLSNSNHMLQYSVLDQEWSKSGSAKAEYRPTASSTTQEVDKHVIDTEHEWSLICFNRQQCISSSLQHSSQFSVCVLSAARQFVKHVLHVVLYHQIHDIRSKTKTCHCMYSDVHDVQPHWRMLLGIQTGLKSSCYAIIPVSPKWVTRSKLCFDALTRKGQLVSERQEPLGAMLCCCHGDI